MVVYEHTSMLLASNCSKFKSENKYTKWKKMELDSVFFHKFVYDFTRRGKKTTSIK